MSLLSKLFGKRKNKKQKNGVNTSKNGAKKKPSNNGHKTNKRPGKPKASKPKKTDWKGAAKKGLNTTALGTKQKKTETKIGKKTKLKTVNALTRNDFLLLENASRLPNSKLGNKSLEGNKKGLAKKIGSKTAESAYKSKAATGVMQGMSKVDVFSGVGEYNKAAKKAIKKTKKSTSYNVGYGVGMALDMGMGGVGAKGESVAAAIAKAGAKKGAKKVAEKSAKESAKKFVRNRAGELVAETPSNVLDAAKMSLDENGKVDKDEFKKYMALNTGLTAGVGGAVEGVGGALTKKTANRVSELLSKQKSGALTKDEAEELGKKLKALKNKNANRISGDIANKQVDDVKASASELRLQKKKAKGRSAKDEKAQAKWDKAQAEYDAQGRRIADREHAKQWSKAKEGYSEFKGRADEKADTELVGFRSKKNRSKALEKAKEIKREGDKLPSREEISAKIKDAQDRLGVLKEQRANPNNEAVAKTLDNAISKVEKDIAELKRQEGVKWNSERIDARIKELENGEVSAPKTESGTITPKAEENADIMAKTGLNEGRIAEIDKELKAINEERVKPIGKERLDELNLKAKSLKQERKDLIKSDKPTEANPPEDGTPYIPESMRNEDIPFKNSSGLPPAKKEVDNIGDVPAQKIAKSKLGDAALSVRRLLESSLVGFERVGLKGNQKLLDQVNNVYLSKNRAASWITEARTSLGRKKTGKSLNDVFDEFGLFGKKNAAKNQDFQDYLLYKHAKDRIDYDKPVHMAPDGSSLFSKEEYDEFINEIKQRWDEKELEAFSKEMTKYYDDMMQFRVDCGLVTKEWADTWKKMYPNYVPTSRDFEDGVFGSLEKSVKANVDSTVKTATGGVRPIQDLYQQTVRMTDLAIRNGEQNKMMQLYAEALGVSKDQLPKSATLDDLTDVAISVGGDSKNGYKVSFFADGERVEMPVDKQIAKGLRELNGQDFTRLLHAGSKFSGIAKPYKGLITDYNIIFGVRNGARDMQQAVVNSKNTRWYCKSLPEAMSAITNNKNAYRQLYEQNGGKYSALVRQGDKVKEPGKGTLSTVISPLNVLENINSSIEIMPRMAEFIGTIKKNADDILKTNGSSLKKLRDEIQQSMYPGAKALTPQQIENVEAELAGRVIKMTSDDVVNTALRNSSEVTLNFSRSGVITRALNMGFVPYLNPSVQGLSKTIRMMTDDGWKGMLNFGMKLAPMTLAPAAINEILLADDENYQALNTRDKDSNFFIPLGEGKYIKIPKPRENAVLAEPVEYGLRWFFDKAQIGAVEKGEYLNKGTLFQMWESAKENIGPVGLNENIFSPLLRLAQNKTWYGGSIESTSDVLNKADGKVKNSEIADEQTSALAKMIGQAKIGGKAISDIMHLSPKKIDDLMDSYIGVIYDLGISQSSEITNGNPVLNQFVKDSVFSNKRGTELWAEFEKANSPDTVKGKIEQKLKKAVFGNTILGITKGKTVEAQDFLNEKGYDDITYSDALVTIMKDKDLTPKQREEARRKLKIAQNKLRKDLVYGDENGNKFVTSKSDPLRTIAKLVGIDKAMKDYTFSYKNDEGKNVNQYLDAYKKFVKGGGGKKEYLDFYCDLRETLGRCKESKSFPLWETVAVQCTQNNKGDALAYSFVNPEYKYVMNRELEDAKIYKAHGFTLKNYRVKQRALAKANSLMEWKGKKHYSSDLKDSEICMVLANKGYRDGAYFMSSHYIDKTKMYAARYLNSKGYTWEQVSRMAEKNGIDYISKNGTTPQQVIDAINNSKYFGNKSSKVKAAVYNLFGYYGCPFGSVDTMDQKNDTGIMNERHSSYSGGGGYGYRRRGRSGGGKSGGETPKGYKETKYKKASVKTVLSNSSGGGSRKLSTSKISDVTFKSTLNDAYRKALKKRVREMYKSTK